MKKTKRFAAAIVMAVSFAMLLGACSKDNEEENVPSITQGAIDATTTPAPTQAAAPTESQDSGTDDDAALKAVEEKVASGPMEIRDLPSTELVKEIKIGWSLGNTMDATGSSGVLSEISWGNPKTTMKMIDNIKEAGFNTLRIPVTWQNHIGAAPDYTIDKVWMDRVQEIVNYAYANDMYVIINLHHEDWYSPYYASADTAIDELKKIWAQIADRFQNYDEHLIFEGMNEPRHKGDPDEWTGGNEEGWEVINQLNAAFVETIRGAGGNNSLRHLMIPPYAASSSVITWTKFEIPEDDKIIVSIHAYTPYDFALNINGGSEWSASDPNSTKDIDYLMQNLNEYFISKEIPVILGEFGAVDKNNIQARVAWGEYYVKKAHEIGVPCIAWDNNGFSGTGEKLGLLNRFKNEWQFPEIVDAFMKGLE
jgi:endoglucanase